jgi:hypothetical protein
MLNTAKRIEELRMKIAKAKRKLELEQAKVRHEALTLLLKIRTVSYHFGTVEDRSFLNDPALPTLERKLEELVEVEL